MKKDFNFFLPITFEKGTSSTGEGDLYRFSGVASDNTEDLDSQFLEPEGFDFSDLINKGFVNWNHNLKEDPGAAIGEVTKGEVFRGEDGATKFGIEGYLWGDSPLAQKAIKLQERLVKSGSKKSLGFSIEGKAIETDPLNKKRITKARITGVALTPCPKNSNTFVNIIKGEYSQPFIESEGDEEIEEAIQAEGLVTKPESVEHNPKELTKGQVYEKIFEKYPYLSLSYQTKIYNFIHRYSKLTSPQDMLTPEKIDQSFAELEKAEKESLSKEEGVTTETELNKAEGGEDDTTLEKGKDKKSEDSEGGDEDEEEAKKFAKSAYDGKMSKEKLAECMIRKGYGLELSVKVSGNVVEEMNNLDANGGNITTGSLAKSITELRDRLEKAEQNNLLLSEENRSLSVKLDRTTKMIRGLFNEVSEIQKGFNDELSEKDSLIKGLRNEFDILKATPLGRKSITNVQGLERFSDLEKGEKVVVKSGETILGDVQEKISKAVVTHVTALRKQGRPDVDLEKSARDFSITGVVDDQMEYFVKSQKLDILS